MLLSKATYSAFRLYIFCQYVCSLGIEPTTFCAADAMLYHWATGTMLSWFIIKPVIVTALPAIQVAHWLLENIYKFHFYSIVPWKYILNWLSKCEGCTHVCEILYTYTHTHTHVYIYVYTHHIHTHIYIHTYIHTFQFQFFFFFTGIGNNYYENVID